MGTNLSKNTIDFDCFIGEVIDEDHISKLINAGVANLNKDSSIQELKV